MKHLIMVLILGLALSANASSDKSAGAGLYISGDYAGIDGKLLLGHDNALRLGFEWWRDRSYEDDNFLRLQLDYQWLFYNVVHVNRGKFPLYVGAGGVFRQDFGSQSFGARFPFGLAYEFPSGIPFDIYLEVALEITAGDNYGPVANPALGFHYWF